MNYRFSLTSVKIKLIEFKIFLKTKKYLIIIKCC